ncbi:MAG: hypothetical protein ABS36_10575 [Acidobacteria bacterium SCN 69-37]|nr:MAG: hypothetical protein ABS36_10575 [Acidobacteria bacterium SCN 69-37]
MAMLALFALGRGLRSPFSDAPGFSTAHLLPHVLGAAAITAADFLPFSDHYKARWILLTVPASGLRGVVRGTMAALGLMGVIVPSLVLFGATSALWTVADATVFGAYSAAVLAFYIGAFAWMQAGLPFTRPPDPTRAASHMTAMMGILVVALVLGAIQAIWVFPHYGRIAAATAVLATVAWLAGRASTRVLENRVPDYLRRFTEGPARMFSVGDG